ncbi:hypothetical protein Bca4012_052830 [Brassica carinata]|uniref:Uncharacterized protein n=1 Tax=Brassica carinata TaxID=52824 RepID=A0A8X7R7H9_BRACI|nr:hypothetical protein Bca52824_055358 [Brassica carinata]
MEAVYDNPFTGETVLSNHHLSPPISPTSIAHLVKKANNRRTPSEEGYISGIRYRRGTVVSPLRHIQDAAVVDWPNGPEDIRYKSGRLVPEYRPVASPTFRRNMYA